MFLEINFIISIILLTDLNTQTNARPSILSSNETYWKEREDLVEADLSHMLGYDLNLTREEEEVNSLLMALKIKEMNNAFQNLDFFPAKNFMKIRSKINQSPVYKFIQKIPKGAVLHIHELSMTSNKWVISNLTYWDDLYMCNTSIDAISFRFLDHSDETCNWTLVSEERAKFSDPEEFDDYLLSKISLYSPNNEGEYHDINDIWRSFEEAFGAISGLVLYWRAWEAYLYRAFEECIEDNISYIEFRGILSSLYDKNGRIFDEMESYEVYHNVIENFTSLHPDKFFGARYIYAPYRLVDEDKAWHYVNLVVKLKERFPETIAGFDLVGQEDLGHPLMTFIDPILYLKNRDPPIPFFFHAGETNWKGMLTDGNLYDALLLNTSRIGHGYAIVNHPELMNIAREKDIAIEVCPISNQVLKLVEDLRNHPASALVADSFPLVVSSDDPPMWESTLLSHDFYEFFMGIGGARADLRFLKKLALNSIRYSSLEDNPKENYQKLWESMWSDFIQELYRNITTLQLSVP